MPLILKAHDALLILMFTPETSQWLKEGSGFKRKKDKSRLDSSYKKKAQPWTFSWFTDAPTNVCDHIKQKGCILQWALASDKSYEKESIPAWALHLLFLVVREAADLCRGPVVPAGSDISEALDFSEFLI